MLKKLMLIVLCAFTTIAISGCFSNEPDISGIYLGQKANSSFDIIIEVTKGSTLKDREHKDYKDGYVVNIYEIWPNGDKFLERIMHDGYAFPLDENGIIGIYRDPDAQKRKVSPLGVVKLQENGDLVGVTGKEHNPFYKKTYAKQQEKTVDELSNRLKAEYRQKRK